MFDPSKLTEAVSDLECRTCAEVVVEIRGRSGSYAHAHARFAALAAFAGLLILLFSPWSFSPMWVSIDVVIIYFVGVLVARRSDVLRRLVTTKRDRDARVRSVAASVFFERGIANTESESGVLVYLSLLERRIELLADRGVLAAVPSLEWNRLLEMIRQQRVATVATMVDVLHALALLLEQHLPIRDGDRDELSNVPRFVNE